MAKTKYLIAHGASVVVVRQGERKTINAGMGFDFTEDEIETVRASSPGALRAPVNEGHGRKAAPTDDEDQDEDDDLDNENENENDGENDEPAAPKPKAKAKSKKSAKSSDDDI